MKPLLVLLGTFILALFVIKLTKDRLDFSMAGRIAMAAMLLFTAIGHFAFVDGMTQMIPNFIPAKKEMVLLTGVMEIVFAVGLLLPNYKIKTGWVLILFFLLILPANIKASLENINYQTGVQDGPGLTYLLFRIPLQILFIAWVYFSTLKK